MSITKTSKSKSAKAKATKKAKAASTKKAVQKITLNKELKYVYPKDIFENKAKMKSFRNKVRKAIQKQEASILKLRGEARKSAKSELAAYQNEVLVNPSA